jgi:hypothetical protein
MKTTRFSRGCFVLLCLFILSLVLPLCGCGGASNESGTTQPIQLTDEVKAAMEARRKANKSPKQQNRASKPGGLRN